MLNITSTRQALLQRSLQTLACIALFAMQLACNIHNPQTGLDFLSAERDSFHTLKKNSSIFWNRNMSDDQLEDTPGYKLNKALEGGDGPKVLDALESLPADDINKDLIEDLIEAIQVSRLCNKDKLAAWRKLAERVSKENLGKELSTKIYIAYMENHIAYMKNFQPTFDKGGTKKRQRTEEEHAPIPHYPSSNTVSQQLLSAFNNPAESQSILKKLPLSTPQKYLVKFAIDIQDFFFTEDAARERFIQALATQPVLNVAIQYGMPEEVLKKLIHKGAAVGQTALKLAIECKNAVAVHFLVLVEDLKSQSHQDQEKVDELLKLYFPDIDKLLGSDPLVDKEQRNSSVFTQHSN